MLRDSVVEILLNRFNLCCTELFQLRKKIKIEDRYSILIEVLTEIVEGKIISPHVNPSLARHMLDIMEYVEVSGSLEEQPGAKRIDQMLSDIITSELKGERYG